MACATLLIIFLLLYLNSRNFTEVVIILGTLPTALVGGIWLLYLLDFNLAADTDLAADRCDRRRGGMEDPDGELSLRSPARRRGHRHLVYRAGLTVSRRR